MHKMSRAERLGLDNPPNERKQTNAERIQTMSIEELAEFLKTYFTCEYECAAAKEACICDCNGAIMDWLQSEVEE